MEGFRGEFGCKHLMWIFCMSINVMSALFCRWMTLNKTSTRRHRCHLPLWICNENTVIQVTQLYDRPPCFLVKVRDQPHWRRATICSWSSSSSCIAVASTLSYCSKLPELPVVLDYVSWKGCTATYKKDLSRWVWSCQYPWKVCPWELWWPHATNNLR